MNENQSKFQSPWARITFLALAVFLLFSAAMAWFFVAHIDHYVESEVIEQIRMFHKPGFENSARIRMYEA